MLYFSRVCVPLIQPNIIHYQTLYMNSYKKSINILHRRLIRVRVFCFVLTIGVIPLFYFFGEITWHHAFIIGITFGLIVFLSFHFKYAIEQKALKNYVYHLEHKNKETALHWGRKYYAIKRLGALGIRHMNISIEDEQTISHDIRKNL